MKKKFADKEKMSTFAIPNEKGTSSYTREHSSVGSERLPYKQRVGGSTPSAPTKKRVTKNEFLVARYRFSSKN